MTAIRAAGGDILDLTRDEHARFVAAVTPIYGEARRQYRRDILALLNV